MANAKRLPSGKYRVLVYSHTENGKKKYKSFTADTKKDAEYKAVLYRMEQKEEVKATFSNTFNAFLKSKSNVLSPATIRSYGFFKIKFERDYPAFCRKNISDIKSSDLQNIINDMSAINSPSSVACRYTTIVSAIRFALPSAKYDVKLPQKRKRKYCIPTDAEIKQLLKCAEGTEMEIPIMLACFGMMRAGEIGALTLDDIKGNTIHISKTRVRTFKDGITDKAPKTYSSDRVITVPDFVIKKINEKGYITKLLNGSFARSLHCLQKSYMLPNFRFHDLRHYGASVLLAEGCDLSYVQERGGWSNPQTLQNIYRHLLEDRREIQDKKALEFFSKFN